MNEHHDEDPQLHELVQRMRAADDRQAPTFDAILERPSRPRARWVRWAFVILLAVVGCGLSMCGLLGRGLFTAPSPVQVPAMEAPTVEPQVDFAELQASVDRYFTPLQSSEWLTETDSLLTLNLAVSIPRRNR